MELTILLIVPSAIGLNIIRNNLILLVAGNEYIQAASSLGILAVAIIPAMLANYYINIIMIPLKMEKQVTVATVVSAVVNIALNCLLIPPYKENAAAFTTLIAEITMVIISMYYCRFLCIRINKKSIISAVFGGVSIFLICNFINRTINSAIINIICCVVFSILAYAAVVMIAYKKDLLRALKKL